MKLFIYLFSLGLVLLLYGCPMDTDESVPDSEIIVVNNSDERIVVHYEFKQLADSSLSELSFPISNLNYESRIVQPHKSKILYEGFKDYFNRKPDGFVMIYVFSPDTIDAYPWSEIVEGNRILKRYDLNENDLDGLGWRVDYPS